MKVIAVDPGKNKCAYAIWDCGDAGGMRLIEANTVLTDAGDIETCLTCASANILAIETQFLGLNPQSMISVVEARMIWETCATLKGIRIERVHPRSWQSGLFPNTKRPDTRGLPPKERARLNREYHKCLKTAAMKEAMQHANRKLSQDEADAICIGLYQTMQ